MGTLRHTIIIWISIGLLCCAGCISEREPFVLLLDDSYTLSLLGTNADGINSPDGITIESAQALILTDHEPPSLLRWTAHGGAIPISGTASGLGSPENVVRGRDGSLYVTDDKVGGVWRLSPGGPMTLLAGPQQGLTAMEGITIAPDGSLLAGEGTSGAIFRITPDGGVSLFLPAGHGVKKAEALVHDEDGNLYIADDVAGAIFIIEPGHDPRVLLNSIDGIKSPESLAYRSGSLYILDGESGTLSRWSRTSQKLETMAVFHGDLKDLQGLAAAGDGTLYVTVYCRQRGAGYLFALEPGGRTHREHGDG